MYFCQHVFLHLIQKLFAVFMFSLAASKSFIKANSQTKTDSIKGLDKLDSLRGSTTDLHTEYTFGPLSNVRYLMHVYKYKILNFNVV